MVTTWTTKIEPSHPRLIGLLILILHVDDMLAAGDVNCPAYVEAEKLLKETFNFRSWDSDSKTIEYCGIHLERNDFAWEIHQAEYWKKVKPVTVHKGRSAEDEMNEHDKTQLRALLGSIQWPAVQTSPHIQRSASLISGQQKTNKLRAVVEANQLLKFAKTNMDLRLRYGPLDVKTLDDVRLCIMFDAAHGVREDHTSQGGYLAFLTTDKIFQMESAYHNVDWRSFKLPRVARSSLSAEAQACGQPADTEYICRFWACILRPPDHLRDRMDETTTLTPTLITDATALYDSYHKESLAGASSVDKRTGLEIRVAKEQVSSLNGSLKWVSSERQYADGSASCWPHPAPQDEAGMGPWLCERKEEGCCLSWSKQEWICHQGEEEGFTTTQPFKQPHLYIHCNINQPTSQHRWRVREDRWARDWRDLPSWWELSRRDWRGLWPCRWLSPEQCEHDCVCLDVLCNVASGRSFACPAGPWRWTDWNSMDKSHLALTLLMLTFVAGCLLGSRRRRVLMQTELDRTYERLDQLQRDRDTRSVAVRDYAAMNVEFRQRLDELSTERVEASRNVIALRDELSATCAEAARNQRGANVMAIMMATQIEVIRSLQNRVGLLRGDIRNHPCPCGGYVVVQIAEHGTVWHVDPDCPLLTLLRLNVTTVPTALIVMQTFSTAGHFEMPCSTFLMMQWEAFCWCAVWPKTISIADDCFFESFPRVICMGISACICFHLMSQVSFTKEPLRFFPLAFAAQTAHYSKGGNFNQPLTKEKADFACCAFLGELCVSHLALAAVATPTVTDI